MIIDAHVHLYRGETALDDLLTACDAAGIDKVCLSACGKAFEQPGNDAVRDAFERFPERVLGFGWVRLGEDSADLVDDLADQGFAGLKVINPRADYDDDSLMPVYERAARRGLPILFHCGVVLRMPLDAEMDVSSERMRPVRLDRIARRFPGLTIIGAHLGVPWIDEALSMLRCHPNVYFDCTGVIRHLAGKPPCYFDSLLFWEAFPEKWLFGTDTSTDQMAHVLDLHRRLMARLALPPETRAEILGERMAKILSLTAGGGA